MDSILGLPLDWKDMLGNEIAPLHILVVLKGIDKDGYEVDTVMHTEGLSLSNALGMARFAVLHVEDEVRKAIGGEDDANGLVGEFVEEGYDLT
jgi:hypothetical protein